MRVSNHEAEHAAILRDARKGALLRMRTGSPSSQPIDSCESAALGRFLIFRNSACRLTQISSICWPSRPNRGALRNVINAGRDAVDAGGAKDEGAFRGRRSRVVLTPQGRRQVREKKRRRRCQQSLVTGESAK